MHGLKLGKCKSRRRKNAYLQVVVRLGIDRPLSLSVYEKCTDLNLGKCKCMPVGKVLISLWLLVLGLTAFARSLINAWT